MMDFYDILLAQKISGGGGGGGGTRVAPFYHKQFEVPSTTSITAVTLDTIQIPQEFATDEYIFYFKSQYIGEVPDNHYLGTDEAGVFVDIVTNYTIGLGGRAKRKEDGVIKYANGYTFGINGSASGGNIIVRAIYSASGTKDIGGTYDVKMWLIPKSILL